MLVCWSIFTIVQQYVLRQEETLGLNLTCLMFFLFIFLYASGCNDCVCLDTFSLLRLHCLNSKEFFHVFWGSVWTGFKRQNDIGILYDSTVENSNSVHMFLVTLYFRFRNHMSAVARLDGWWLDVSGKQLTGNKSHALANLSFSACNKVLMAMMIKKKVNPFWLSAHTCHRVLTKGMKR